mgnify:CR=1 FL=1
MRSDSSKGMAAVEPDFAKPGVTPEKCTMPQLKLKCWMHARGLGLPSDCNLKQQHVDRVKAALEHIEHITTWICTFSEYALSFNAH